MIKTQLSRGQRIGGVVSHVFHAHVETLPGDSLGGAFCQGFGIAGYGTKQDQHRIPTRITCEGPKPRRARSVPIR